MSITLKQRLVGAVVLIALGVIFIPILLERQADDSRLTVSMEIPPKPDIAFQDPLEDSALPQEPEVLPSMEESVGHLKPAKQEEINTQEQDSSSAKANAPEVDNTGVVNKPNPDVEKNIEPTKTDITEGWIIQLGSFGDAKNANALNLQLVEAKYDSFVESAQTVAGTVYRVRIGPIKKRSTAEKLADKLKKQGQNRAIIMSYP